MNAEFCVLAVQYGNFRRSENLGVFMSMDSSEERNDLSLVKYKGVNFRSIRGRSDLNGKLGRSIGVVYRIWVEADVFNEGLARHDIPRFDLYLRPADAELL